MINRISTVSGLLHREKRYKNCTLLGYYTGRSGIRTALFWAITQGEAVQELHSSGLLHREKRYKNCTLLGYYTGRSGIKTVLFWAITQGEAV